MALDEPFGVIAIPKGDQRLVAILDAASGCESKQIITQRPNEPFGTTIVRSSPLSCWGGFKSPCFELIAKRSVYIRTPVIMSNECGRM